MDGRSSVDAGTADRLQSSVLSRAALLTVEETRRLYRAYQALAVGSYTTRVGHALGGGDEPYQGPILVARSTLERNLDPALKRRVHEQAQAALERAAGGRAAAPGDPGRTRTALRRAILLASWGTAGVLMLVIAFAPGADESWPLVVFGVALLIAALSTTWMMAVPNRAVAVIPAVEAAVYAELLGDRLSADVVEALERPWRDTLAGTAPPPRSGLDRLAGWIGGASLLAILLGLGGLTVARVLAPELQNLLGAPLIAGIVGCVVAVGTAGAAALQRSRSRRAMGGQRPIAIPPILEPARATRAGGTGEAAGEWSRVGSAARPRPIPGAGPVTALGIGTPARIVLAGIVGGLVFGVGDTAKDLTGWLMLGLALGLGAVIGWAARSWPPLLGYVVGGLVGTWLSVAVRSADQPALDPGTELAASAIVGLLALIVGGFASKLRVNVPTDSG